MTNEEIQREINAAKRTTNHLEWCRWAFRILEGKEFHVAPHHAKICEVIDKVIRGDIKRLIINIPPRHGKTEITTIMLAARILAANPKANIMHLSFSDSLVRKNSRRIRRLVRSERFRTEYPRTIITNDSSAQNHWETTLGGQFHAAPTMGEVTGEGAGISGGKFDGLIILDDMMKPMDARSAVKRTFVNELLNDTVTSRLNHEDTPIICIAQRLHEDDTSAYLMNGGTGDEWDVLVIPAINEGKPPEHYQNYSHARIIDYDENEIPKGALWPERMSLERLNSIRDAQSNSVGKMPAGALVFATQYQQSPVDNSVSLMERDWINWYKEPPELLSNGFIRIDTASSDSNTADFTACTTWATDKRFENQLFGVDGMRIKAKPMQMFKAVADYIEKNVKSSGIRYQISVVRIENANIGAALASYLEGEMPLRDIQIRIELLKGEVKKKNKKTGKVEIIARNKFQRAEYAVPMVQQGRLWLPSSPTIYSDAQFAELLANEIETFTLDDRHANDDFVDTAVLALIDQYHQTSSSFSYAGMSDL